MCILSKWICDTLDDCGDYSDEIDCGNRKGCPSDRFDCKNGQCVSHDFICDGEDDCANGADEEKCLPDTAVYSDCPNYKFKCRSHECIDYSWVCDGKYDCFDKSDEEKCVFCSPDQFACRSKETNVTLRCISQDYLCDDVPDCDDGSDELLQECQIVSRLEKLTTTPSTLMIPSTPTAFPFPLFKVTSTEVSQSDESKRAKCHSSQFRCNDGFCISMHHRCDLHRDCLDGSDEHLCAPIRELPNYPVFPSNHLYPIDSPLPTTDLKVYDTPQTQLFGDDVVFRCRDEGLTRYPVSWSRQDDRPFPPGTKEEDGRLTMYGISFDDAGIYVCTAVGSHPLIQRLGYLTVTSRKDRTNPTNHITEELRRAKITEICGPDYSKCKNSRDPFLPAVVSQDDCVNKQVVCEGFNSILKLVDERKLDPFLSLYRICHDTQSNSSSKPEAWSQWRTWKKVNTNTFPVLVLKSIQSMYTQSTYTLWHPEMKDEVWGGNWWNRHSQ